AITGKSITVGEPYFDRMTVPIGFALIFLMAIAPVLPWRKASTETLRTRLYWPAWGGVAALVLSILVGARGFSALLTFFLAGFAAGAAVRTIALATRRQGLRGFLGRANGGMIVHLGIIIIAVAITASQSYSHQREAVLLKGQTIHVAGHTVTNLGTSTSATKASTDTIMRIRVDDRTFAPELQEFPNAQSAVGKPTVSNKATASVLVAPLEASAGGKVRIRVIVQPLIVWLWIGGGIVAFGAFLAAFPGRRRNPIDPVSALLPDRAAAGPPSPGADPTAEPEQPTPVGVG
ncbi:MAG TPA: cytochrome c-type biogenesis CcmF C-terminal domain-containing protein, partial [Acidimicrobiales bacterium]